MTGLRRVSRCAQLVAAAAFAVSIAAHELAAFAQGTNPTPTPTPTPTPKNIFAAESTRTTTSPDGLTTTTDTFRNRGENSFVHITVVTTKNTAGFTVSEKNTTLDARYSGRTTLTVSTKTYNPSGGYAETIDTGYSQLSVNYKRESDSHEELQYNADGKLLSGMRVTRYVNYADKSVQPEQIPTKTFTWDAGAKTWVSKQTTALIPAQPNTSAAVNATEQIIAPAVASPGKEMMVTYHDGTPDSPSASPLIQWSFSLKPLLIVPAQDHQPLVYDDEGLTQFSFDTPVDATSATIFKGFDGAGKPDAHASVTTLSSDAPVPGMNLPHTPLFADQPGIVASAGAYEVLSGLITVQTQNTSVADTLLLDTEQPLPTLAASDRSIVAALPPNISLGRHDLSLEPLIPSQPTSPSSVPFDAISLTVDPMPAVENVGDTATPTVHVSGMIPGDVAVMEFAIGGSAELASGGTFTSVPVVGNVASTTIVGVRSGEALVRFHLRMLSLAPLPPK